MRLLICGGRDWGDTMLEFMHLFVTVKALSPDRIIEGGAEGADTAAYACAKYQRIERETFWADWSKHGRSAGPVRNRQMLTEGKPDEVLAAPGGVGTHNMISQAEEAGILVRHLHEFPSSGSYEVENLAAQAWILWCKQLRLRDKEDRNPYRKKTL